MTNTRISRVLQVLSLIAFSSEPVRLKEIGSRLGLHSSMVSRIVSDLIAEGLIAKNAYRSVIAAPDLAVLGLSAGKNHPLSAISAEVLQQPMMQKDLSCEFATVARGGLYHFYEVRRNTPAPEPLWRSDPAAVIFAAQRKSWETVLEELKFAAPADHDQTFPYFRERFLAAQENGYLMNYHSGRFWQLTSPVSCGGMICALSVAGVRSADYEKISSECARLRTAIRSRYEKLTTADA